MHDVMHTLKPLTQDHAIPFEIWSSKVYSKSYAMVLFTSQNLSCMDDMYLLILFFAST